MTPTRRPAAPAARRAVGRPRQYDDAIERELIIDAGYTTLRDHGTDLTIAHILAAAAVSTRSFYRHFPSKDALLCAMYRRDAEYAAGRLATRLASASSPRDAVVEWIDEIFGFVRSGRRAERTSVMRSIAANHAVGVEDEAMHARALLIAPLRDAVVAGVNDGTFHAPDPALAAELVSVAVMHAAGLSPTAETTPADQGAVTLHCLRALGA